MDPTVNACDMYESFFGLRQEPFSIAPDPRFLYMSDKHSEALDLLSYGLARGASFVLLTGEIGAGKTTVWRRFLEMLPSNFDVASVVNPKLDATALLARVCDDLNVELPEGAGRVDLIDALHGHLLLAQAKGRRTLIVIDEAQALSSEVLEQLRLLTNLDSSGKKLQVMLIGQPELRHMLEHAALEPLAQRIVARYHLPALSPVETAGYIAHRLKVAGLQGPLPFDAESIGLIHRLCRGVPRRINAVCDRALTVAQASGQRRVDRSIVERAAPEVFGRSSAAPSPSAAPARMAPRVWAMAAGIGLALAAIVWFAPQIGAVMSASPSGRLAAPAPAVVHVAPAAVVPMASAVPALAAPVAAVPSPVAPSATPVATSESALEIDSNETARPAARGPAANWTLPSGIEAAFVPGAADETPAWRALAGLWGTVLGAGEPCAAAAQRSLQCYRSSTGLGLIRQLDRPGVLRLVDERGRVAHVLLVALAGDTATLDFGGTELTLPLMQLARVWRGEFATYWRAPAAYRLGDIARADSDLGQWLLQQLSGIDGRGGNGVGDEALRSRIAAFQLAQGLSPDGLAGPLTLMQIGRASGVDEPRLTRHAAARAVVGPEPTTAPTRSAR